MVSLVPSHCRDYETVSLCFIGEKTLAEILCISGNLFKR
jgi:hypothetical protein